MKKITLLLLILSSLQALSQINSPNGSNLFYYNGAADVTFRFADRGTGGRAFVHADGNILALNFGNDFNGGVTLGSNFIAQTNGNFRSNAWQPWNSASDDFYIDVEPGTRILRTRNWNTSSPNISATGIHTGVGYFESSIGIGTTAPEGTLELKKLNAGLTFDLNTNSLTKIISKGWNSSIDFSTYQISGVQNQSQLHLNTDGNVGIGTAIPRQKLSVNGKIRAKEIKVETANWPDYVFEEGYSISKLAELEKYIKLNKHLPEIPSAKEVDADGIALGEMNKLLLKKIEELTLHLIEKDKELANQEKQLQIQSKMLGSLSDRILKLEVKSKP